LRDGITSSAFSQNVCSDKIVEISGMFSQPLVYTIKEEDINNLVSANIVSNEHKQISTSSGISNFVEDG